MFLNIFVRLSKTYVVANYQTKFSMSKDYFFLDELPAVKGEKRVKAAVEKRLGGFDVMMAGGQITLPRLEPARRLLR